MKDVWGFWFDIIFDFFKYTLLDNTPIKVVGCIIQKRCGISDLSSLLLLLVVYVALSFISSTLLVGMQKSGQCQLPNIHTHRHSRLENIKLCKE